MTRRIHASTVIHRDRPCDGNPRRPQDASLRYLIHGPIRPMVEPGFLARLFGRGK